MEKKYVKITYCVGTPYPWIVCEGNLPKWDTGKDYIIELKEVPRHGKDWQEHQ